jgi:pimeloyl-ACP methyl ester carboxylesterase
MTSLLETPNATVAYDEIGSGPPIVMLASGAHDRHDYDGVRELLAGRFRTLALDWPGHGESPAPRAPTSAIAFADAAEAFVEQLAPAGAVVVGNSVGGFSAARLAVRRPALVRGLALVDSGGFAGLGPHQRLFCALMGRPRFLRAIYPAFSSAYMRSRTDADRRARRTGVAITRSDPGLAAVSDLWRSFASPEHDLRSQAASITAPTLVMWGRRDPVVPLRVGRRIAQTIPGARLEVFDSGHVPQTAQPERFAQLLGDLAERAFAAEQAAAAA